MAFYIKNVETDALARKVAALKNVGLTQAVHDALANELAREQDQPSLVDVGVDFLKRLRDHADMAKARPADKAFRDSLYERD